MGQGRANNSNTLFLTQGMHAPIATDGVNRTDAPARAVPLVASGGVDALLAALSRPPIGQCDRPRAGTTARGNRSLIRAASLDAGTAFSPAPSHSAGIRHGDRAISSAVVLGSLYALLVILLLLAGCAQPPLKTARPGIDAAGGTAQSLQTSLDTIEYHARELRKGVQ